MGKTYKRAVPAAPEPEPVAWTENMEGRNQRKGGEYLWQS